MPDLAELLHRATDDLGPQDPHDLLDDAVRAGASIRRRRRAWTAVGSGAAAVALVAVGIAIVGGSTPADRTSGVPVATAPATPTAPATSPPQVAVARGQVGATFARIQPGTISHEHDVPADRVHTPGGYESTFDWNGYLVSLMITSYDGSARAACERTIGAQPAGQTCVAVPGGWSIHDDQMTDTNLNRWVNVYFDTGFQVWALIYNSGSEKGDSSAGPPPLGVAELERVATSDLWFD